MNKVGANFVKSGICGKTVKFMIRVKITVILTYTNNGVLFIFFCEDNTASHFNTTESSSTHHYLHVVLHWNNIMNLNRLYFGFAVILSNAGNFCVCFQYHHNAHQKRILTNSHPMSNMVTSHKLLTPTNLLISPSRTSRQKEPYTIINTQLAMARESSIDGGSNNDKNKKPNKISAFVMNMIASIQKTFRALITYQKFFVARFKTLPRRAKLLVSTQLFVMTLLFGSISRQIIVPKNRTPAQTSRIQTEVPYSTFMDLAERHKKGAVEGSHPAIQLNNVVIGRDRVYFRLEPDLEKIPKPTPEQLKEQQDMLDQQQKMLKNKATLRKKSSAAAQQEQVKQLSPSAMSSMAVQPRNLYSMKVNASPEFVNFLRSNEIPFRAASTRKSNALLNVARATIASFYLLVLLRMYRSMNGGGGSGAPGKLAKRQSSSSDKLVKFDEIEGIDDAKFEVMELVDALRNPSKYAVFGARAPKGLLLVGPPGTGKTMLARATAATAGVPLLYCSGSDFVEMFVGRGAARVRKTFSRAGKMAPCIVFIDELDALGKSRDLSGFKIQSNDEAEQTLNQLLACMDGLDSTKGVCVLAATNRKEVLDPALLRPGRFDRIVKVELPSTGGRERILRVHAKKLPSFTEGKGIDEKRLGR